MPELGDKPIQPELREMMNELAVRLDNLFNENLKNRKNGFCLMVFPLGNNPQRRANYISNCKREDIIILLREQLARFEGQPEIRSEAIQ